MSPARELVTASVELDVQFFELDPLGIAWHGNHLRWFEIARCALLQRIGYDYPQMMESGYLWPIVELDVRYVASVRYGQRLTVGAALVEWEHRMRIRYRITDAQGSAVATGATLQCAIDAQTRELQWVSPRALLDKLEPFL